MGMKHRLGIVALGSTLALTSAAEAGWRLVKIEVVTTIQSFHDGSILPPGGNVGQGDLTVSGPEMFGDGYVFDHTFFSSLNFALAAAGHKLEKWVWRKSTDPELEGYAEFGIRASASAMLDLIKPACKGEARGFAEFEVQVDSATFIARVDVGVSASTAGGITGTVTSPPIGIGTPLGGSGAGTGTFPTPDSVKEKYGDVCPAKTYLQSQRCEGMLALWANGGLAGEAKIQGSLKGSNELLYRHLGDIDCK